MRKNFLFRSLTLAFLACVGFSAPRIHGMCGTTVNWHNLSDTGCDGSTNNGITANVIDQNIDVIGVNALVGGIHVEALTCDILITITNGDAIITGSGNRCDLALSDFPRLYLFADAGRTITFSLANSLLFSGTADGLTQLDLLITASGTGEIFFNINGGESVSFSRQNEGSGGTTFAIGMTSDTDPATPIVSFVQTTFNILLNSDVIVGPASLITFVGDDAAAVGALAWLPRNDNLRLLIQNGGAFNVAGHPLDLDLANPLISDIDLTALIGASATFLIDAAVDAASLSIINSNTGCPSNLLIDPFCQGFTPPPFAGFVITGPVGVLTITDQSYLTYIGTATNVCCTFTLLDECGEPQPFERLRNGSALIVDAPDDDPASAATFNLLGSSAIYFISGVSNCGTVLPDFTVNTSILNSCAGNIVLDVEGPLNVVGSSPDETGLEILSLVVAPTGCPVTVDSTLSDANFPARTFARQPNGDYVTYNLGAFLVNNRMNFSNTSLIHTDTIHKVYEHFNLGNPNLFSEPTYVGGDSYTFFCHSGRPRPTMAFYNSKFRVHTNVASTGVDFLFTNTTTDLGNTSSLIFYNNGRCIDDGYGRNMILGTSICFENCITTTGLDSHLNVFQESAQDAGTDINLWIITGQNTSCITEGIPSQAAIASQNAVQTIYLNNASNFSIGTNGAEGIAADGSTFPLTIPANVLLDGANLSFETRGGTLAYPASSGTTGEGGIFVDALGSLLLLNNRIASFGAMVTKSRGGIVDLPSNQVYFAPRIGITEWQPDMADPAQRIIVPFGTSVSDFTLDWGAVIQTYCCSDLITSTSCFIPYDVEELPAPCASPVVTQNNLFNLPTVQGEVDQLQILRSRIGDLVHLNVDGGFIRELVFLQGYNSAEAPTGFIVLQNAGLVGLGSAHKDVDSLEASIVLGVNGVILVANGNGNVELNEDVIINNVCHILSGTAFGQDGVSQVLQISSTTPKELRIKSTGILDLSDFTTPFQILEIAGQVKLVCEPGARIALGGGTLRFAGQAQWFIEPAFNSQIPVGVDVTSYDDLRAKLSGNGLINMTQDSSFFVGNGAFFGVETYLTCSNVTNINWIVNEQASIQIGSEEMPGGAFQIGDTVVSTTAEPRSVSFSLLLEGQGALFELNRQGFFGLASGIVDKQVPNVANDWSIGCLSNVDTVSLLNNQGTMILNQIASGIELEASLFAIGSEGIYTFSFNRQTAVILGGGNLVKVNCTQLEDGSIVPTSVVPTVTNFAGISDDGFLETNIISGKLLLIDRAKGPQPFGVSAQVLFNYLLTNEHDVQRTPRANVATDQLNIVSSGFVNDAIIRRDVISNIRSTAGVVVNPTHSLQIGAVNINLDVSGAIINTYEIIGS